MNNHVIVGVLVDNVRMIEIKEDKYFISGVVQDKTRYNNENNLYNNFHFVRYGNKENLLHLKENLVKGTPIYLSGIGLYNKKRYYNIIANEIGILNNIEVKVMKEQNSNYYENFFPDE